MVTINIKPMSVNRCWQGRRFKTPQYKQYEKDMFFLLPKITIPDPPFNVYYEFGFSSSASDLDNPIKPLQDILQKRYGFNDKLIHEMLVKRVKVKKGKEYIKFELSTLY
jgi:Holliday junction resolvase RusA-like endonuclease